MSKHVIAGLAVALLAATTLSSAQAQSSTVSVYTAHAPEIYNEVVPMFEAATGISVSLVQAGSGDIVQRARAEAASPLADVIWSIGGEALEANSDPLYKVGTNWLPYTGIPMVFVVNTDMVSDEEMPASERSSRGTRLPGSASIPRDLRISAGSATVVAPNFRN